MDENRIHRATSDDGTEIAGRVNGEGPPLLFVHGGLGDAFSWVGILRSLTDRFTCYRMSTRGRVLSADDPDHSAERLVQDVVSFADSIREPVGLVGLSSGAALVLGAAACTPAVAAVAAYEPGVFPLMGEDLLARFRAAAARMDEAAAEGRLTDAARIFIELVANGDELATLSEPVHAETWEHWGRNIPVVLQEIQQLAAAEGPSPLTDATVLANVAAPVMLLRGSRSALQWFDVGVRHVAEHVPDVEVREIAGAGHLGPVLEPGAVAEELVEFFSSVPQPT